MITGNTVKELNSESTNQTTGERTTVTQLLDNIQTLRECTNRNNNKSQERSTVHQHGPLEEQPPEDIQSKPPHFQNINQSWRGECSIEDTRQNSFI